MSGKFTTGQMIDRLGLNDVAVNQKGWMVGYDHKGNLLTWDKDEEKPTSKESNEFSIYFPWVNKDIWEINYHFVSFEEAQHAHVKEKRTVVLYQTEDLQYRFIHGEYGHFKQLADDGIDLDELIEGKWLIEN
ncbi:hypothetical protein [Bacillus sp. JJ722]|uniref:hypothetical protein n=1 Tax=Bacillus sp. JJ722 TaxID=3122973 RepID=UPI002FFFE814